MAGVVCPVGKPLMKTSAPAGSELITMRFCADTLSVVKRNAKMERMQRNDFFMGYISFFAPDPYG